MRKKVIAQRALFDQSIDQLIRLITPERVLKKIDAVISGNDRIVACVHEQLTDGISNTGSRGMSAEQILRVAILKQLKQYSWRELAERINDGICLRWFTRFYSAKIPHFTALQKAVRVINADTWTQINDILVESAKCQNLEKGQMLRVDTTVVETNIAYPTDARLLWDSIRVLTRLMVRIREQLPFFDFGFANRTNKDRSVPERSESIQCSRSPKTGLSA